MAVSIVLDNSTTADQAANVPYTSGSSLTPVAGHSYAILLAYAHGTITPNTPTTFVHNGTGLTLSLVVANTFKATGVNRTALALYLATAAQSVSGGTFTATWASDAMVGVGFTVVDLDTYGMVTANKITAAGTVASSASLTATLSSPVSGTTSRPMVFLNTNGPTGWTQEASWTELQDNGQLTPNMTRYVAWHSSAWDASVAVTNTSGTTNLVTGLIAFELTPAAFAGTLTLSGDGTLTTAGVPTPTGTLTLSGSGTLAATGVPTPSGTLTLSGSGSLVAIHSPGISGALTLSGSGTLAASGTPAIPGALTLSGSGTLATDGTPNILGTLTLSGSGTLAASGVPGGGSAFDGTLTLSGSGTLATSGTPTPTGTLTLTGSGSLGAAGIITPHGTLTLTGSGSLVASGTAATVGALVLSGAGTLTTDATVSLVGVLTLSGSGELTVHGFAGEILTPPERIVTFPAIVHTATFEARGHAITLPACARVVAFPSVTHVVEFPAETRVLETA